MEASQSVEGLKAPTTEGRAKPAAAPPASNEPKEQSAPPAGPPVPPATGGAPAGE